jgi:hypothetical protein
VGECARAMRRQGSWWQRGVVVRVGGWQGRQAGRCGHRCAAMSRGRAVEISGSAGEEGRPAAGRGEDHPEGLLSTVGTPAPAPADWYLADKQLLVISFTALMVCCCSHWRIIQLGCMISFLVLQTNFFNFLLKYLVSWE